MKKSIKTATSKTVRKTSPSERLAAQNPKAVTKSVTAKADAAEGTQIQTDASTALEPALLAGSMLHRTSTSATKVRFKWVVKHKGEVPVVTGDTLTTRYLVQFEAAYEPLSILDGQATVQGNPDNRAFGLEAPKADLSIVLASKAIADTFIVGRAYHSDFLPAAEVMHPLY